MSTKSREVIWGGTIMGAEIRTQSAREAAQKAAKKADRAETRMMRSQPERSEPCFVRLGGGAPMT